MKRAIRIIEISLAVMVVGIVASTGLFIATGNVMFIRGMVLGIAALTLVIVILPIGGMGK